MNNPNVLKSCERHINAYADNCSGFVNTVARDFHIELEGQANHIFLTLLKRPEIKQYGVGWDAARSAASDAVEGLYLVIASSFTPIKGKNGHTAIVTGLTDSGEVIVYGGKLNEPDYASRGIRIQSLAWAAYKLTHPYVAREPPAFFGVPIPIPLVA
jgi:hypothetical protein